ncbi:MAG: type II secretion system F family protein [Candidatus Omnitrophica bacterium]|nr:type II secretion system F family protein [Candidatus Omnitrophota bacterium]MBU1997828.1 type II secretion system F family protein [Candidatus Omnitrophota bacterium]MBU4334262.1 type II secretion system F family protein [Candidatus Omnitrophota bacterium]
MNVKKTKDLLLFYEELSSMISGGLAIVESLGFLRKEGNFSLEIKNAIVQIEKDIIEGSLLSEALRKHISIFPQWHVIYINAAEKSGKLAQALSDLCVIMFRKFEQREELKKSLFWPKIYFIVFIMICPFPDLLNMVISLFKEADFGGALTQYFWSLLLILIWFLPILIAKFLYEFLKDDHDCKMTRDRMLLYIPFISKLLKTLSLYQFLQTLALLNKAGQSPYLTWNIASEVCSNQWIGSKLKEKSDLFKTGTDFANVFSQTEQFSPKMISMIKVGEKSGSTAAMLKKCAYFYEREYEKYLNVLGKVLPKFAYLALSALILFTVMSGLFKYITTLINGMPTLF